jgi:uncharacterized protein YidB (DUF937 family)
MSALLGLLALAGYQNRDKLAELLKGPSAQPATGTQQGPLGGLMGNVGGVLAGGGVGSLLGGGPGRIARTVQAKRSGRRCRFLGQQRA